MHATRPLRTALKWSALGATGAVVVGALARHSIQPVRATADEHNRPLPGDDLIANPLGEFTNAVTIHATPRAIWSWLAQMGAGRAGWYSYDALDNGGQTSATTIVPALQRLEVGMVFPNRGRHHERVLLRKIGEVKDGTQESARTVQDSQR